MKPHPTKSKPRIAKGNPPHPFDAIHAKPSPRQPDKGARMMWASSPDRINSGRWFVVRPTKSELASWCLQSPVLVLDLSDAARERVVKAIATTLAAEHGETLEGSPCDYCADARAVLASLASLGDTPAGEGRGKA